MIVMPSTNSSGLVHYLAGRFPGKIGWLMSPGDFREPRPWLPYAIDNGKFKDWGKPEPTWTEESFLRLLDRCRLTRVAPRFVAVPDEVANAERTLELWHEWVPTLEAYKWPLAFVAQDGMTWRDVPKRADVVFVGGSTEWKWRNATEFAARFPRVHIGRVNWFTKLEHCEKLGVESCDGSGFFRGGEMSIKAKQLVAFLEGHRHADENPTFHAIHDNL